MKLQHFFSSEKTICRCLPPENRWYKALARCSLFNFVASVSFWRFKNLNGFFPRSSRRIFLAEKSEIPSFLANFRVEFTLVDGFLLIIPLVRWIFLRLLAVFSLFRFSLLPVSSNLLIVRDTVQYQETTRCHVLLFHFHAL